MNILEWREKLDKGGINGEDAFSMWRDWSKANTRQVAMKATYEGIVDFISEEVIKEVAPKDWSEFRLNRQLDDYLSELKTRIAENWKGLE